MCESYEIIFMRIIWLTKREALGNKTWRGEYLYC